MTSLKRRLFRCLSVLLPFLSFAFGIMVFFEIAHAENGTGNICFATDSTSVFSDTTDENAFYYAPVEWAVSENITTGFSDGTFRPWNVCNRATIVTFLWRYAGKPQPQKLFNYPFTDSTGNSDFDTAITWAAENGIVTGYDDGTFRPWGACNRASIVTFLWRYAGKPRAGEWNMFTDMTANSDFNNAITWAAEKGITTGWADRSFRPWNSCNRASVVTFLYRFDMPWHTEHEWGDWQTNGAEDWRECVVCGEVEWRYQHEHIWRPVSDAPCEERYVCRCGASQTVPSVVDHEYGPWIYQDYDGDFRADFSECIRCGHTIRREPLDWDPRECHHIWGERFYTDACHYYQICTSCGYHNDEVYCYGEDHNWITEEAIPRTEWPESYLVDDTGELVSMDRLTCSDCGVITYQPHYWWDD